MFRLCSVSHQKTLYHYHSVIYHRVLRFHSLTTSLNMPPLHFDVKDHVIPGQYIREYPGAVLDDQEDILHLHVKQYIPKDQSRNRRGAVTIIGAHANGFPKELYEPFWDELSDALKERGQAINSIWIADVATQGQSGIINENKIGNDPSWNDHPRDLLHIINHFRTDMPRPLVGIGHSMGGNHLTQLALIHPRLLTSLILIDPVIATAITPPNQSNQSQLDSSFTRSSTFRRDLWPSRARAAASFKKNHFYQSWHPRVLDLWNQYGLRDLPTAIYPQDTSHSHDSSSDESANLEKSDDVPVTLATNKHQEVFMFLRPNFEGKDAHGNDVVNRQTHPDIDLSTTETYPFYRPEGPAVFKKLPHLRPSTLYLWGGKSPMLALESRDKKIDVTGTGVGGSGGVKEGRVKEEVIDGVGHLVPMVAPKDCAGLAAGFLADELERWRGEEEGFRKAWEGRSRLERMTMGEEWKRQIGGDPRVKSSQKL